MRVRAATILLDEADLGLLLKSIEQRVLPICSLKGTITADGILIAGEYPSLLGRFGIETTWKPSGRGMQMRFLLAQVRVLGTAMPWSLLKQQLLQRLAAGGLIVEGNEVVVPADHLFATDLAVHFDIADVEIRDNQIMIQLSV